MPSTPTQCCDRAATPTSRRAGVRLLVATSLVLAATVPAFAQTPATTTQINEKAAELGLGAPTSGFQSVRLFAIGPVIGKMRSFERGNVYYSTFDRHVAAVYGSILTSYERHGGPQRLGFPFGDETGGMKTGARLSEFGRGLIAWSGSTGARLIRRGPILEKWDSLGREGGRLGLPIRDQQSLADGGEAVLFEGGAIFWKASIGAVDVDNRLLQAWTEEGRERGDFGYPVGAPRHYRGLRGYVAPFEGGTIVVYENGTVRKNRNTAAPDFSIEHLSTSSNQVVATVRNSGGTGVITRFECRTLTLPSRGGVTTLDVTAPAGGFVEVGLSFPTTSVECRVDGEGWKGRAESDTSNNTSSARLGALGALEGAWSGTFRGDNGSSAELLVDLQHRGDTISGTFNLRPGLRLQKCGSLHPVRAMTVDFFSQYENDRFTITSRRDDVSYVATIRRVNDDTLDVRIDATYSGPGSNLCDADAVLRTTLLRTDD